MPRCESSANKSHEYLADSNVLYLVACRHCGKSRSYKPRGGKGPQQIKRRSHALRTYLLHRRRTRRTRGLLNVAAPLDFPSARDVLALADGAGLTSNTAMPHLTYAEGLNPLALYSAEAAGEMGSAIESLRSALWSDSQAKVTGVHSIPRRDERLTDLLSADVELSPSVKKAAEFLTRSRTSLDDAPAWCLLPQFPFHFALGACHESNVKSALSFLEGALLGRTFSVDAGRMKVLAPSERPGGVENGVTGYETEELSPAMEGGESLGDLTIDLSFLEDGSLSGSPPSGRAPQAQARSNLLFLP